MDQMQNAVRQFLPQAYWFRKTRGYAYGVDYNLLQASAVAQEGRFQVDNGWDFLCLGVSEIITTDATGATEQTFPEMLVSIQNEASGYLWTQGYQHAANLLGRSPVIGRPMLWPWPYLVEGGQSILVQLTNLEANARRVWISFFGVLIQVGGN